MAFRDDLDALAARHAALDADVAARTRERDRAAALLAEARAQAERPVLDDLRVAAPCPADWSQMTGDERVRHCGQCQKNVYNLTEMTRDEAEALIVAHEGRLCVRYYQRADGTILLKDCVIGVRRRRQRRAIAVGIAASLAGALLGHEVTDDTSTRDPGRAPAAELRHVSPGYTMGGSGSAPTPTHGDDVQGGAIGIGSGSDAVVVTGTATITAPATTPPNHPAPHPRRR